MDVKFGTSGLRGLAVDLVSGSARSHVAAFAQHLLATGHAKPGDKVFVARDKRASSPELFKISASAVCDAGLDPVDCGEIPTPALACHAFAMNSAAIMITGSHIPADRNGIKFYLPGAEITKSDEAAIVALASAPLKDLGIWVPATSANAEAVTRWHERHSMLLAADGLSGLKIGVHEHSSVAADFLADLLSGFGAVIQKFGRTAQFTPVDTEAVAPEFVAQYRQEAAEHRLDAIVTTDADGDRPLVADENGTPLPGDLLGWLACLWIKADHVATPVTSNSAISTDDTCNVSRTRVGSPYVIVDMEAAKASGAARVAGFEANGGFLLGSSVALEGIPVRELPTRDSTMPILAALRVMKAKHLRGSQLSAFAGFRATASNRLQDYAPERSARLLAELASNVAFRSKFVGTSGMVENVDLTDGVRLSLAGGEIMHFRASGNAPEMRCYVEATSSIRASVLLEHGMMALQMFEKNKA